MKVIKLIVQRVIDQLGQRTLTWVIVPVIAIVIINLVLFLIVQLERWLLGSDFTWHWVTP
jgi:hypothetical protein